MKRTQCLIAVGASLSILWFLVFAAMAQQSVEVINYQGNLTDLNGPMDETAEMTFAIFDIEEPAGSDVPRWSETIPDVQISQGIFNVELGSQVPFPADLFHQSNDLYLRISVEGETLAPLQHLASVPYALKAVTANHALTATSADIVLNGTVSGNLLVDGSVGVGTDTPESLLHLESLGSIDLIIDADTNNSGGEDQNARVVLRQDGGQVTSRLGYRHEENDLEIMQEYSDDLIFGTSNVDRMTITRDGEIGIGTSSPEAKLHVAMPRGILGIPPDPSVPSTVKGVIIRDAILNTGNQLEIQDVNGLVKVVVDSIAQVGIGTADPETPLEVKGVVSVDGSLGIGTTTPQASLEIDGGGQPHMSGFLIIRNNDQDAGIRIYDGNDFFDDVKHHIFNDNDFGFGDDVLRIVPEGSFASDGGIMITQGGSVGINMGGMVPSSKLAVRGNVAVLSESTGNLILELGEGLDYAEGFNVTEETLDAGTVLAIDEVNPGHLTRSVTAYDRKVAGIVAGAKGLGSGVRLGGKQFDQNVALAGRVYCRVETTHEEILAGDLLTTSDVPGHAMKVVDYSQAQGAVLGKAMEPLEKGKRGLILVLVTLQ